MAPQARVDSVAEREEVLIPWTQADLREVNAARDVELMARELWNNASDEFRACMAAGVPMTSLIADHKFVVMTKGKIGFERDKLGRITRVVMMEDGKS